MIFQNRAHAGEQLGKELLSLELRRPLVLAIPRGGVPVATSVASLLACALDVIPLIKIPIPWMPEASYGALAVDGTVALNMPLIHRLELSEREIEMRSQTLVDDVQQRARMYRDDRPFPLLEGRSVVIVDDGLGSGYSMLAAVDFVKKKDPFMIVVASPVASDPAFRMLAQKPQANLTIVLVRDAEQLFSLAAFYRDFTPVSDEDVVRSLSLFGSKG